MLPKAGTGTNIVQQVHMMATPTNTKCLVKLNVFLWVIFQLYLQIHFSFFGGEFRKWDIVIV